MTKVSESILHLFARRWCLPILAELKRTDGSKFVSLSRQLGATPAAVRQSLDRLIELGLAEPNPGYGHPLRPEYVLTAAGNRLGPAAIRLDRAIHRLWDQEAVFLRWSMPTLVVVSHSAPARFSEIGGALSPVTDRALAQTLKRMQAGALITREIKDSFPPIAGYAVGEAGRTLLEPLEELARAR